MAPIKSIDPNELNFQDLNVLNEAIVEAPLVLLGDQDHGDAPTFLAKTRIIKFLHQKVGFDVLIFESDFYGIHQTWDWAKAREGSLTEYRNNIYPLWVNCVECADLFQHIDTNFDTANEITVSGADPIHNLS